MTVHKDIRAVNTTLDRSKEVTQCTHRRYSEGDRKAKLGSRGNESELIERCMKLAIGNSAQSKLLSDSNCTFNHQNSEMFDTKNEPQVAWNYIFVSLTSNQDVIGII